MKLVLYPEYSDPIKSFETCKNRFAQAAMASFPYFDAIISLAVDASDFAIGAVLKLQLKSDLSWKL